MDTFLPPLPALFSALADPTRLAVVDRLSRGSASVSELQSPFDISRPAFLKHLKVLEEARLVVSEKSGRVRTVSLHPRTLFVVSGWIDWHRRQAQARYDRLQDFLGTENADDD